MNSTKIIARVLFWLTRVLSIMYFALSLLSITALTTGWGLELKEGGKYFVVFYPFTQKPLMLGDYNSTYIIFEFLTPLTAYGLFFLLVGNVFKVFYQPRLFTLTGIKHLRLFYLANLILPGLVMLFTSFFTAVDDSLIMLTTIHFILGVFAYFLAAIFRQGLNLQHQQDLII